MQLTMQRTGEKKGQRSPREKHRTEGDGRGGFLNHRFQPLPAPLPYRLTEKNLLHLRDTVGAITGRRPYLPFTNSRSKQKEQLKTLHGLLKTFMPLGGEVELVHSETNRAYFFVEYTVIGESPLWFHLGPLAERQDIREPLRELLSATFTMMNRHMGFSNVLDASGIDWLSEMANEEASSLLEHLEEKNPDERLTVEETADKNNAEEILKLVDMYANSCFWYRSKDEVEDTPLEQALTLIRLTHTDILAVVDAFLHAFKAQDENERKLKDLCAEALVWAKEGYNIYSCLEDSIDYEKEGYADLESFLDGATDNGYNIITPDMVIGFSYRDNALESYMEDHLCNGYQDLFMSNSCVKNLDLYEDFVDPELKKTYSFYDWILRFYYTYTKIIG